MLPTRESIAALAIPAGEVYDPCNLTRFDMDDDGDD